MVLKYIGFPSACKGKRLHEIALLLRNAARSRVVYRTIRNTEDSVPTFWLLTKSEVDATYEDGKGSVFSGIFVENGVQKGEMAIPRKEWILPDWHLASITEGNEMLSGSKNVLPVGDKESIPNELPLPPVLEVLKKHTIHNLEK